MVGLEPTFSADVGDQQRHAVMRYTRLSTRPIPRHRVHAASAVAGS